MRITDYTNQINQVNFICSSIRDVCEFIHCWLSFFNLQCIFISILSLELMEWIRQYYEEFEPLFPMDNIDNLHTLND